VVNAIAARAVILSLVLVTLAMPTARAQQAPADRTVISDPQAREAIQRAATDDTATIAKPSAHVLSSGRSGSAPRPPAGGQDPVRVLAPVIVPEIRVPYGLPGSASAANPVPAGAANAGTAGARKSGAAAAAANPGAVSPAASPATAGASRQ
jgi:hypothetical protein